MMPVNGVGRFHCRYQGCSASYRRQEHRTRHESQHSRARTANCPFCDRSFSRSDTLRRHIRRDHEEEQIQTSRATRACRSCRLGKVRCRGGNPCRQCREKGHRCIFEDRVPQPDAPDAPDAHASLGEAIDPEPSGLNQNDPQSQIDQYIQLYFARFHPQWPFLHRATFSASHEPSLLLYAVVMIGMWVSGKDSSRRSALDLHRRLGACIRQQQATWQDLSNQQPRPASTWPIATYQGVLLYLIFSLLSAPHYSHSLNLTIHLPVSDQRILTALVQTCLRHNVFFYPAMLGRYQDIDDVTCIWVGVEEIKRLGLALYKVCNRCRSARQGEPEGDSNSRVLCLSDLRFPAPDSNHLWEAKSNMELSNLLAQTSRSMNPEGGREFKLISESGEWLDDVDPGFNWV
ncbi:transcription factor with C2H2 and Zn(2)-Cys(6) DNA binding domain [Aspergillus caelatus]|uniref:Transcription factor with C2H2 and Zn(2)-Cys(6) DNA binding domain n=1 Tax=Aspergillus caelatus TaxID=61420 RepID=A0A5N7AKD4_9EURO|nr:transcription factor with C2H2 and Zn(2)-Cys(6) DNA binding domain [Aspergillus caelatus]KAE8370173.1 transcription factor with C2H2 and Zn(2)-Cys(6) DNA binding domain [Aspergillus caelatus]